MHVEVRACDEALQNGRHRLLVFLPDVLLVLTQHLFVELQHIKEPQRRVDSSEIKALLIVTVREEGPLHPRDQIIERILEDFLVTLCQSDARQSEEGVAAARAKPWESCP